MDIIENALIKKIFLGFQEIRSGNNFTLRIQYETEDFGFGTMTFNPLDIPKILKTFKINDIKDLEGLYIKIKRRKSEIGYAIQPILESDKWINTDTRYLGDDYLIESNKKRS